MSYEVILSTENWRQFEVKLCMFSIEIKNFNFFTTLDFTASTIANPIKLASMVSLRGEDLQTDTQPYTIFIDDFIVNLC